MAAASQLGQSLMLRRRCLEDLKLNQSLKKRAWRHGRAWKMKIRAWKNQDPCFNFYKHMLFYINIPFKLIVSDALRIAIKYECIF